MNQTLLLLGICAVCTAFVITLGTTLFLDHQQEKKHHDTSRFKNNIV